MLMVVGLLAPQVAFARGSSDKLAKAKSAYEDGEYLEASVLLEEMFRSSDMTAEVLRLAHIYLAASYFFTKREPQARKEFDALFRQSPLARVDPVFFPPEIVELANEEAKKLENEQDQNPSKPSTSSPSSTTPDPASKPRAGTTVVITADSAGHAWTTAPPRPARRRRARSANALRPTPPSIGLLVHPVRGGPVRQRAVRQGRAVSDLRGAGAGQPLPPRRPRPSRSRSGGIPFISYTQFTDQATQNQFNEYRTIYIVAFWTGLGIYAVGVVDSLISRAPRRRRSMPATAWPRWILGLGRSLNWCPPAPSFRF